MILENNSYTSSIQSISNAINLKQWDPALADETLLSDVQIEEVQGVINSLNLPHFDEPDSNILSSGYQDSMSMVLSLPQNLKG